MFDLLGVHFRENIGNEISEHKTYIEYYNMIDELKKKDNLIKQLISKNKRIISDYNNLCDTYDNLDNKYKILLDKYQKIQETINIDEKFINITMDDIT